MKIIKCLGLLFLFSTVGAIALYLYYSAYLNGSFAKWELRKDPPSRIVKLLGLGYVQIESRDIYQYSPNPHCSENCWTKVETPDLHTQFWLPLSRCAALPSLDKYVDSVAICEMWGNGTSLTIDAIDQDGKIYSWTQRVMGGQFDLGVPLIGAVIGFIAGILILLIWFTVNHLKEQNKVAFQLEQV